MAYEQRLGGTHQWRKLRQRALRVLPLVCSACGIKLDPSAPRCTATAPELDHVIPAKAGGADDISNVRWMCSPCNRRKSDRLEEQERQAVRPNPPRTFVTSRTW